MYFSQLIGKSSDIFQIQRANGIELDYLALVLVLVMTALCIYSTKVASEGNIGASLRWPAMSLCLGLLGTSNGASIALFRCHGRDPGVSHRAVHLHHHSYVHTGLSCFSRMRLVSSVLQQCGGDDATVAQWGD